MMPPLRCVGLTRTYQQGESEIHAVRNVTLEVSAGEFVVVTGPSGSGKSTLLHLLGGIDRPDSGQVFVNGVEISAIPEAKRVLIRRRQLGFVLQFFSLLPTLCAVENVAFPLLLDGVPSARARGMEALEQVGLAERSQHLPAELSGGQQQRVAIARAIATKPKILLADEPTGNLDSRSGEAIFALLHELTAGGMGLLLVTHDPRAISYADRTIRLRDGSVLDEPSIVG